jgi:hypothetical protein
MVEGIKMGATVSLNGVSLAPQNITDQFLRYILPLPRHALERGESVTSRSSSKGHSGTTDIKLQQHTLTVTLDPAIATNGRFMACSGGWDYWAPYSRAGDERGSRIFSLGLVQPLYLVPVHRVFVTRVVPRFTTLEHFPADHFPIKTLTTLSSAFKSRCNSSIMMMITPKAAAAAAVAAMITSCWPDPTLRLALQEYPFLVPLQQKRIKLMF